MSSIVIELQRQALDNAVPVSDLLRKALAVASKLRIAELKNWAENELNGYRDVSQAPECRKITGSIHALNPFHGWQRVLLPDNEYENLLNVRQCGQSITELESLLEHDLKSASLYMDFPANIQRLLMKLTGHDMQVALLVPRTDIYA